MIGDNQALHNYLARQGIQKAPALIIYNVFMGIGFLAVIGSPFILAAATSTWGALASGALGAMSEAVAILFPSFVYLSLAEWLGGCLTVIIMAIVVFGSVSNATNPVIYVPLWLIYIIAWLYVNILYEKYKRLAKERIATIAEETSPSIDHTLEKGVLQQIILRQNDDAVTTLRPALSTEGGDALLWYLTGVAFANMKMHSEALSAFDRAIAASPDAKTVRKINRSQRIVRRKMQ